MSTFDSVFAPIEMHTFIREYFNKKPFCQHGDPGRFDHLLDEEAFFESLLECRALRAVFPKVKYANIEAADARDMHDAGATICAGGIHLAHPPLGNLARELKDELGYLGPVSVNSYYSPPGTGFEHHLDPRIVTAIQISGSKRWHYCPVPLVKTPITPAYDKSTREKILADHIQKNETEEVIMKPGSLLCLPAGCIHWAEAVDVSLSLNIAFDYIGFGLADHLTKYISKKLLEVEDFRSSPLSVDREQSIKVLNDSLDKMEEILRDIRSNPFGVLENTKDGTKA